MPEGKWNAYEHDIRIPMVVAGPGIPAGTTFDFIASNVDTMPSIFGLLGVPTPPSMDGRSFAHLLLKDLDKAPQPARDLVLRRGETAAGQWRTEQLIEYGGGGPVVRYEHLEDIHNNTFRCLRVVDPSQSATIQNGKLCEFVGWADWVRAHTHTAKLLYLVLFMHSCSSSRVWLTDLRYVGQNFTSGGANSEWELFDLDKDP